MSADETQIDLQASKTEAEWQRGFGGFWLATTPKIFEWLGWVAVLAGLQIVHRANPSIPLMLIVGICYSSLLMYFLAFFARFSIIGIPGLVKPRAQRTGAVILSGVLGYSAYQLARYAAEVLSVGIGQ